VKFCINCDAPVSGKYCHECGQKTNIKRLDFKGLTEEISYFFTHIEKGFLRTSKEFIIHPGVTSLNYLKGKRKNYQKPVSYFLIWVGLYILVHNMIINRFHYEYILSAADQIPRHAEANLFLRKHFSLFLLPLLIVSAISVWLVLARPRFYFIEIVVLMLYGGGTYFMMTLASDIVLGVLLRININHYHVFLWQTILSALYNAWFTYDFFRRSPPRYFWLRMILVALLVSVSGLLLMEYLPLAWLNIFP